MWSPGRASAKDFGAAADRLYRLRQVDPHQAAERRRLPAEGQRLVRDRLQRPGEEARSQDRYEERVQDRSKDGDEIRVENRVENRDQERNQGRRLSGVRVA